jgi:hypothetical protein
MGATPVFYCGFFQEVLRIYYETMPGSNPGRDSLNVLRYREQTMPAALTLIHCHGREHFITAVENHPPYQNRRFSMPGVPCSAPAPVTGGHSNRFVFLTAIFVACLLISNLIAGRLIEIAGVVLPAAVLIFPITYILGDVCTEVYGYRRARLVIWAGFAANCLMLGYALLTIALPAPPFFFNRAAYATVLGQAPRVVVASLAAFWCGEFLNAFVLSVLKRATRGRHLWSRTIGSTLVGQAADTGIFLTVAFAGLIPWPVLLDMVWAQYLFKVGFETLCTPLTYTVVGWLKRAEGLDVFDDGIRYNPLRGDTEWIRA